jgi:hypothetical protein
MLANFGFEFLYFWLVFIVIQLCEKVVNQLKQCIQHFSEIGSSMLKQLVEAVIRLVAMLLSMMRQAIHHWVCKEPASQNVSLVRRGLPVSLYWFLVTFKLKYKIIELAYRLSGNTKHIMYLSVKSLTSTICHSYSTIRITSRGYTCVKRSVWQLCTYSTKA